MVFGAFVLAVFAVGGGIALMIRRPIYTLLGSVERVRRDDLDFHVPIESQDEHGELMEAVEDMRVRLQERLRSRSAIERYMSPQVYEMIQRGELKLGGESREITVLKSDIRDFTTLSERMEPQALVGFLNDYFEAMVAPIKAHEGEVDKYMGDSILAKFGATEGYSDHARRAVLAMVEMIEACERLNDQLRQSGKAPIRMGIGANTGPAVVGNIGATERMEYTIISDAVNTAQRIEELCKAFGWDLLISDSTYAGARDVVEVGRPWSIPLRGKTGDTLVYPILGRAGRVPGSRRKAYEELEKKRAASGDAGPTDGDDATPGSRASRRASRRSA
jgi:adenylate cyclase